MATDIAKVKITVDSTDAEDASKDLDRLAGSADKAGREIDDLGGKSVKAGKNTKTVATGAQQASKGIGGMGRNAGMAGIQIQQLVGQIQGGQSAMLALSQQSADLGFVLGAPMIGVLVSLGATLAGVVLSSLNKAKKGIQELIPEADELRERFKELTEEQAKYLKLINAREIAEAEKKTRQLNAALADEGMELNRLRESLEFAYGNLGQGYIDSYTQKVKEQEIVVQGIRAAIDEQTNSVTRLNGELDILSGKAPVNADWWGDDASASQAAFQIRMENLKAEQAERDRIAAEGQAFGQDMFQRGLQEREFAKQASNEAELEAELSHRNAMTEIYARSVDVETAIRKEAIAERMQAEIVAEKNKQKISMSLASAFSSFMQSESKALFEFGKIGAAGKATMDAFGAINATLAQGGAFAAPAAVAIGVAAFANVSKILSTSYGSAGGSAAAIPPAPQQQTDQSTTQNVQITVNAPNGDGGSIAATIQDLFDSGQMRIQGGGVVSV